jgi:hypothetical protein
MPGGRGWRHSARLLCAMEGPLPARVSAQQTGVLVAERHAGGAHRADGTPGWQWGQRSLVTRCVWVWAA